MTTNHNEPSGLQHRWQGLEWCPECEIEYAAHQCASCPLCPMWAKWKPAIDNVRRTEPYRIITETKEYLAQREMNEMTAAGWDLVKFTIAHAWGPDTGEGGPVFVALFHRRDYDPDAHWRAVDAEKGAESAVRGKRIQIESMVEAVKTVRDER